MLTLPGGRGRPHTLMALVGFFICNWHHMQYSKDGVSEITRAAIFATNLWGVANRMWQPGGDCSFSAAFELSERWRLRTKFAGTQILRFIESVLRGALAHFSLQSHWSWGWCSRTGGSGWIRSYNYCLIMSQNQLTPKAITESRSMTA